MCTVCCKTKICKADVYKSSVLSKTKNFVKSQMVVKKKESENDLQYFIIFLADISAIFSNPYTTFVLLDTDYNVSSEYIDPISTSVFDSQNYDVCLKTA